MERTRALAAEVQELGRRARRDVGTADVDLLKRLKAATGAAEIAGRIVLHCASGPWSWATGTLLLAFHFAVEAQLNHSIQHGAYAGLPGAEGFTPRRYETLALPLQCRTWGDAHRIHHANPSLLELDPDTVHPLFRVHIGTPWRPWHLLNTFLGSLLTFEVWAWDYDRFLKERGHREPRDRGELKKFLSFFFYQYVLFAVIAGPKWKQVVLGTLAASVIRNLIFTGLQTGSSVGGEVSTRHALARGPKRMEAWYRFQVETSKDFRLEGIWRVLCGGLDRHIEHHLLPNLPPDRLHAVSPEVRRLCREHGVRYDEFPSFWASLADSVRHLWELSV